MARWNSPGCPCCKGQPCDKCVYLDCFGDGIGGRGSGSPIYVPRVRLSWTAPGGGTGSVALVNPFVVPYTSILLNGGFQYALWGASGGGPAVGMDCIGLRCGFNPGHTATVWTLSFHAPFATAQGSKCFWDQPGEVDTSIPAGSYTATPLAITFDGNAAAGPNATALAGYEFAVAEDSQRCKKQVCCQPCPWPKKDLVLSWDGTGLGAFFNRPGSVVMKYYPKIGPSTGGTWISDWKPWVLPHQQYQFQAGCNGSGYVSLWVGPDPPRPYPYLAQIYFCWGDAPGSYPGQCLPAGTIMTCQPFHWQFNVGNYAVAGNLYLDE